MKPGRRSVRPAEDEGELFRREMRDVIPAPPANRVALRPEPPVHGGSGAVIGLLDRSTGP